MAGTQLTLLQALGSSTLRPLVIAWAKQVRVDDQIQFLLDVNARKPAKYLFATYIAEGAPKLLNLAEEQHLRPVRTLAAQGDPGYAKMGAALSKTAKAMLTFMQGTFERADTQGFMQSEAYLRHRVGSRNPAVTAAVRSLKLPVAKANQFDPLMKIYMNPRSAEDALEAYKAMQKIVAKSKLDPALTKAGKSPATLEGAVAGEKTDQAALRGAVQATQAVKLIPAIKTDLAAAKTYLTSALATMKTKGKPGSQAEVNRMFTSGQQRVTKAHDNYVKAVRLDPQFSTKNTALAADKKKVDEQWVEYRKALGK